MDSNTNSAKLLRARFFKLESRLNDAIWKNKERLMGQVLTIIDAAFSDPEQRKAVKDLVKQHFYGAELAPISAELTDVAEACGFTLYEEAATPTDVIPASEFNPYPFN